MKKLVYLCVLIFTIVAQSSSCKKNKTVEDTCQYDGCDPRRQTIITATNWTGQLGYYNNLRKWAVNYHIPSTYDSTLTCIICLDIADSLKSIGRIVTFSGDIKEGCGNPKPELHGQGIYYINPTKLQ